MNVVRPGLCGGKGVSTEQLCCGLEARKPRATGRLDLKSASHTRPTGPVQYLQGNRTNRISSCSFILLKDLQKSDYSQIKTILRKKGRTHT